MCARHSVRRTPAFTPGHSRHQPNSGLNIALGVARFWHAWGIMFLDLVKRVSPSPRSTGKEAPQSPILIVDDEPIIRTVARRMLEASGYAVLEAKDGADALEKVGVDTPLLLLVADVNMPGITGDELSRRFRMRQPNLNCLFLTGCVDQLFDGRPVLWDGEAFLEKPFTERGLREAVSLLIFGHLTGSHRD